MSRPTPRERLRALRGPVPRTTVLALAALMSLADAFWVVSVQGAVGAIERAQHPFALWLLLTVAGLPLFVAAVVVGLAAARRIRPDQSRSGGVLTAALAVAVAGTVAGSLVCVLSAVLDYRMQFALLQQLATAHFHSPTTMTDTLALDVRGARWGTLLSLVSNVVLVGWVVALRGGRLAAGTPRRRVPAGV